MSDVLTIRLTIPQPNERYFHKYLAEAVGARNQIAYGTADDPVQAVVLATTEHFRTFGHE